MTAADQRRQLDLLAELNRRHQQPRAEDDDLEARIPVFELAYRMQMAATDAFDVEQEPQHVRDAVRPRRPGPAAPDRPPARSSAACASSSSTTATSSPGTATTTSPRQPPLARPASATRPIAALLTDLKQRGLFEETLVLCGGEFGRTPAVELVGGKPGMGRDHNHWGFTVWLAGGGVKGGHVHGATDEFGYHAVENHVHVHDLHATILHLLGFDHTKLTYRYAGRDFRLTDVHGEVVRDILA